MRALTSLVVVLSLAACGGAKPRPANPEPQAPVVDRGAPVVDRGAPATGGAFPGYYPVGNSAGDSITTKAGSQTVQLAVVRAKDGSARKLVWIDAGGRWSEIATLPRTVSVRPDFPPNCAVAAPTCETVAITSFSFESPSDVLMVHGLASGNKSDYYVTWFPRWDASRGKFVVNPPIIEPRGKP
ncbi:MAG: hypothetical protein JWO36_5797 [Myxococcales bacterium]|nr:hypothetical protein [Myxococcales bacterium]